MLQTWKKKLILNLLNGINEIKKLNTFYDIYYKTRSKRQHLHLCHIYNTCIYNIPTTLASATLAPSIT